MFDPIRFLDELGIEYKVRGVRVSFRCFWCSESDLEGDNYGFRLDRTAWGCFRDRSHSGSLAWVVAKIANWTYAQAEAYLDGGATASPIDELRRRAEALGAKPAEAPRERIEFLPEFLSIRASGPTAKFFNYLKRRGFDEPDMLSLRYVLWGAVDGRFKDRIILPVYRDLTLVGWTARAVGEARLRYLAHPADGGIKDALFNEQNCSGGRDLYVVEGPFDALKLDWYGPCVPEGVSAVALMGTAATPAQAGRIAILAKSYERVIILLDRAARSESARLRAALPGVGAVVRVLEAPHKDPGELTAEQARAFLQRS